MSRKLVCMLGVVLFCTTVLMAAPENAVVEKKVQDVDGRTGMVPSFSKSVEAMAPIITPRTEGASGAGMRGGDIVWDNYPDGFNNAVTMSQEISAYALKVAIVDDFMLPDAFDLTGYFWEMGWWNPDTTPPAAWPPSITLTIYSDVAGEPYGNTGTYTDPEPFALYNVTIPWASVTVTNVANRTAHCEVDMSYTVAANTRYWIGMYVNEGFPPQYGYAGCINLWGVTARYASEYFENPYWTDLGEDIPWGLRGECLNPAAECGNGVRECLEECDGTDDAECPGDCLGDCTCDYQVCVLDPPACIAGETEPCDDDIGTEENAGCSFDAPGPYTAESTLQCGVTVCGTAWDAEGVGRDIDQYNVVLPSDTIMTVTFKAEFPVYCGFLEYNEGDEGSGSCDDTSGYWYPHSTPKCMERTFSNVQTGSDGECVPSGTYFLQILVNPDQGQRFPCAMPPGFGENDYYITLDCAPCSIIRCPEDSLFSQPAQGGDSDYWYASASDEYYTLTWYENFDDVLR